MTRHRLTDDQWDLIADLVAPLCWRRWKNKDPEEPSDHALGRSCGGFSTNIHVLCDSQGHPLPFQWTAGQVHESTGLDTILIGADAHLSDSEREPIVWPVAFRGDKGYRAAWMDESLIDPGIPPGIPSKQNEDRDARNGEFDGAAYRQSNIVESSRFIEERADTEFSNRDKGGWLAKSASSGERFASSLKIGS